MNRTKRACNLVKYYSYIEWRTGAQLLLEAEVASFWSVQIQFEVSSRDRLFTGC